MQLGIRACCIGIKEEKGDFDTGDQVFYNFEDVWSNMSGSSYNVQKRQWEALALVAGGSDGNVGQ